MAEDSTARGSDRLSSLNSAPPDSLRCGPDLTGIASWPLAFSSCSGHSNDMSTAAFSSHGDMTGTLATSPPTRASVARVGPEDAEAISGLPSCQKAEIDASTSMAAVCSLDRLLRRGHGIHEGIGSIPKSPETRVSLRQRNEKESNLTSKAA
eukprot:scaffold208251_cov30-Tisochrysis_lutea.AAC.6